MKQIVKFFVLSLALGVLVLTDAPVKAANETITIYDNSDSISQDIIFAYANIGPGFRVDAPIDIVNHAITEAQVKLIALAPDSDDPNQMSSFVQLSLLRNDAPIGSGTAENPGNLIGATYCLPAGATGHLDARFSLPASVGNAAQNTSMRVIYTFEVTVGACEVVTSPPVASVSTVRPPNTSESGLPFLALGGLSLAAFLATLVFLTSLLIPILLRRKREKEASRRR